MQVIGSVIKQQMALWRVGLVPGIAVLGIVILARLTGMLQSLEWTILDRLLQLRPHEVVDERVVIVGINEVDIRSVGAYPIPDREIAQLLRILQTYQPRVIGLDSIRDLPVEPGHIELVSVFKNSKNLIGIEKVLPDRIAPPPNLPSKQVGFSDAISDADGSMRRYLLSTPTAQGYKFSLALRLAEAYLSTIGISLENGKSDRHAMRFGATELPRFLPNTGGYVGTDAGGVQVLINFRNGKNRFRTLSLNDIKTKNFNPKELRDRIVLIGIASPSLDIVNSSAIASDNPGNGKIYGVEIQAHAVSQIINAVLDRRPLLRVLPDGWEYLWIVIWGILGISLSRLTQSPIKNFLAVSIASLALVGISYTLLLWGWWIPVAPALLVFVINGVGLTAFYQHDRYLRTRINERQFIIDSTFDAVHNGPLQTLAKVLRQLRDRDLSTQQLIAELEHLNQELRAVFESVQRENITQENSVYLGNGKQLDLQQPLHQVLYAVYTNTLERDFPCFETLKVKIRSFDPIDEQHLSIEQKRGICRFLEEALCNVGKHATGVTRLNVTFTQHQGWAVLRITDNGRESCLSIDGRGTQQSENLAVQLRGQFKRSPISPQGTLCELTWRVPKI